MALKSKKRRIAELDGSEGPAKKQRIETTPVTLKEGEEARFLTSAVKNSSDIDGAIAQLAAEIREKAEKSKKESSRTADNSTNIFKEKHEGIIAEGDLDHASKPTPTKKDDSKPITQDGNDHKVKISQTVGGEMRATPGVVPSRVAAQACPAQSHRPHRPHRPLRPLRQYPGPRTGHFYKPHAVVLTDGTLQIVWYPK